MSEEIYRTINEPEAFILEASANALTQKEMCEAFGVNNKTLGRSSAELGSNLGIVRVGRVSDLELRTRAVAMAVHDGLLLERDLKRPGEKYVSTIASGDDTRIVINHFMPHDFNMPPKFRMPSRPNVPTEEVQVDAQSRTYLSCLAWAMSRETIAAQFAPAELSSKQALSHVYKRLHALFGKLAAKNAPQAVAHASFLGLISFEDSIMEPHKSPEPTLYYRNARIRVESFAHKMPHRFGESKAE